MSSCPSYEGSIRTATGTLSYCASTETAPDGARIRSLTFDRIPYLPSEVFNLMNAIAPVPSNNIPDVKGDFLAAIPPDRSSPKGSTDGDIFRIYGNAHHAAFGDDWMRFREHAQALYDGLPYRSNNMRSHHLEYGNPSLKKTVGSITNHQQRARLFNLLHTNRHSEVITTLTVEPDGTVIAPSQPIVQTADARNTPTYVKTASLCVTDGLLEALDFGNTPDGVVKVVRSRTGKSIPIPGSYHVPLTGVSPSISWTRTANSDLVYEHSLPTTHIRSFGGQDWKETSSSVFGCMVLASVAPEVTGTWPRSRGYTPHSRNRTQTMGPLQAALLSVLSIDKILQGSFIRHIEGQLNP